MNLETHKVLRLRDKQYSELRAQWRTAASRVYASRNDTGLTNYNVPEQAESDELLFMAFGLRFFMRFRHGFGRGTIEYGVITEGDIDNQFRRVPVTSVQFDRLGNLSRPHSSYPVSEYEDVHLKVLASHLNEFIKAAYGQETVDD